MAAPSSTKERYEKGLASARKLFGIIEQMNLGIVNLRAVTAKLDADAGVTSTNYTSSLTAKEIAYTGYTAIGTATSVTYPHPALDVSEAIAVELLTQLKAFITDIGGTVTKLNADAGITVTDFAKTVTSLTALGVTGGSNKEIYATPGSGLDGELLQAIGDTLATALTDMHTIAAKLDLDADVATTTYEASCTAKKLTQSDH